MPKKRRKKGFSLVELIVTITIIVILGTISFLSFQGYSQSARDSKRASDINNIKKSLELFSLKTGKYPIPDNYFTVDYNGDDLWYQGTVGDTVVRKLSRNLPKKPLDPLMGNEYVYSTVHNQKEYEVMGIYEREYAINGVLQNVLANTPSNIKIDGTYNGMYITTSNYVVPTPSIINAEVDSGALTLDNSNITSQVMSDYENQPQVADLPAQTGAIDVQLSVYTGSISKNSTDQVKIDVVDSIQTAYSGSVLSSQGEYAQVLSNTSDEDKISFVNNVILQIPDTSTAQSEGGDVVFDFTITPGYFPANTWGYGQGQFGSTTYTGAADLYQIYVHEDAGVTFFRISFLGEGFPEGVLKELDLGGIVLTQADPELSDYASGAGVSQWYQYSLPYPSALTTLFQGGAFQVKLTFDGPIYNAWLATQ